MPQEALTRAHIEKLVKSYHAARMADIEELLVDPLDSPLDADDFDDRVEVVEAGRIIYQVNIIH